MTKIIQPGISFYKSLSTCCQASNNKAQRAWKPRRRSTDASCKRSGNAQEITVAMMFSCQQWSKPLKGYLYWDYMRHLGIDPGYVRAFYQKYTKSLFQLCRSHPRVCCPTLLFSNLLCTCIDVRSVPHGAAASPFKPSSRGRLGSASNKCHKLRERYVAHPGIYIEWLETQPPTGTPYPPAPNSFY